MAEAPLALIFTSILLGLKSLTIIVEIVLRWRKATAVTLTFWLRLCAALMGCFVLVLGSIATSRNPITPSNGDETCTKADADIIGDGVRTATWAQVGILAFSAIAGIFHRGRSGVQEVGAGLIVTHIALALALLVPMKMKNLSPVDSVLGTMILDAQNVALSIQLLSKQTLASRWQTFVTIVSQLLGTIAIGILIKNFAENRLSTETCSCLSAYWWGWLSNCSDIGQDYRSVWSYYGLRVVTSFHCAVVSGFQTLSFDKAKRREENRPCEKCMVCRDPNSHRVDERAARHEHCRCDICEHCRTCRECNKIHCPQCTSADCKHDVCPQEGCKDKRQFSDRDGFIGGWKYSQLPASVGNMFFEYSMYALLSLLAAEGLLKSYKISPSSPWSAIGQITSTVIAGATAIRFLWVFSSLFWKKDFAPV